MNYVQNKGIFICVFPCSSEAKWYTNLFILKDCSGLPFSLANNLFAHVLVSDSSKRLKNIYSQNQLKIHDKHISWHITEVACLSVNMNKRYHVGHELLISLQEKSGCYREVRKLSTQLRTNISLNFFNLYSRILCIAYNQERFLLEIKIDDIYHPFISWSFR